MKLVDGELWLKGDNIMLGYYGDPDETALVMEDGWLKTGDLASVDEKGYITIIGRKKNVIVLPSGENIYPETLEGRIAESDLVKDCLVKEMEFQGKSVLGVEVYPDMAQFKENDFSAIEKAIQELVAQLNTTLPPYERLVSVVVRRDDFHRMPSMKIDRHHT